MSLGPFTSTSLLLCDVFRVGGWQALTCLNNYHQSYHHLPMKGCALHRMLGTFLARRNLASSERQTGRTRRSSGAFEQAQKAKQFAKLQGKRKRCLPRELQTAIFRTNQHQWQIKHPKTTPKKTQPWGKRTKQQAPSGKGFWDPSLQEVPQTHGYAIPNVLANHLHCTNDKRSNQESRTKGWLRLIEIMQNNVNVHWVPIVVASVVVAFKMVVLKLDKWSKKTHTFTDLKADRLSWSSKEIKVANVKPFEVQHSTPSAVVWDFVFLNRSESPPLTSNRKTTVQAGLSLKFG